MGNLRQLRLFTWYACNAVLREFTTVGKVEDVLTVLYETTVFWCLAFYVDVGPQDDGVGMTPSPLTAHRWFYLVWRHGSLVVGETEQPNGLMKTSIWGCNKCSFSSKCNSCSFDNSSCSNNLPRHGCPAHGWRVVEPGGLSTWCFLLGWDA